MWRWPIREVLVAFVERLRFEAAEQYRHECLMWALRATKKKPKIPDLLRADGDS